MEDPLSVKIIVRAVAVEGEAMGERSRDQLPAFAS